MATTTAPTDPACQDVPPAASLARVAAFRRPLPAEGRACHALIARLPGPPPAPLAAGRLDGVLRSWLGPTWARLWETRVPAPYDAPASRERMRREALRPVHDERSPLRAVLLRYSDGSADLVLVALRSRVPRAVLDEIVDVASGGAPPVAPSVPPVEPGTPWWSRLDRKLGDPGRAGTVDVRPLDLPRLHPGLERVLVGALALAQSRYSGEGTARLGLIDTDGHRYEPAVVEMNPIDEEEGTTRFLARVGAALDAARGGASGSASSSGEPFPELGVVFSSGPADRVHLPFLAPPFPLTVQVAQRHDGPPEACCWVGEGAVSATFRACVERLAHRFAKAPGAPALATIPLMDAGETARVLRLGGSAGPPSRTGGTRIDRRFEEMARRRPDVVAVVDDGGTLTYRRLDERADAVAAGLRALGLPPAGRVGVCLERDASLIIAMLGVLKAGHAYVPMDPHHPRERLGYVTDDAGLPVVIAGSGSLPAIPGVRAFSLGDLEDLGENGGAGAGGGSAGPDDRSADDPAYVIYTSGSTGRPKGVVVPHRNVGALLDATAEDFALGTGDVWTLFHSSAFDFSVWEIWGCLLTGGRLVVVPYWTARDADAFRSLLAEQRITILNQTPSAFSHLVRADRRARDDLSVRLLVFGGEPLDARLLAPWFARYSPARCRVVNMFGITETTVHVTAHPVTPADAVAGSRSVGRALPGWTISVRDLRGRVLPPGAAGEIHVGGAGVADGYLGRPGLTAERFVPDGVTGERLYRSGDRGRLLPDGRLEHLGRLDDQVKIRGHRVELGEIRSALAADPRVVAAVVTVRRAPADDPAGTRVDGYVVLAETCDPRHVLADVRRVLPDYMVPATLTAIPEIPLTANGKPDLARLPPPAARPVPAPTGRMDGPDGGAEGPNGGIGPGGPAAEILGIWSRCLGVAVTGDDNFFELGGNSLLVLQAITAMREKGLPEISVRDFYANSTAHRLISLVEARRRGEEAEAIP
ncbi:amino acid adenylation domain-containing protein [Actinomadura spongiicola]|uniref:Amino acid adenylation domain-containing protein n=1 Tax=Actinomadura spongiicola TaxID=2303421 RepID=A0A372GFL3_9ACTN|nr:non-ribosomal peptide synthetase [Actinomadura spongiicola]RFS84171.1 amino acid adenylation domain-containing protein [Actinomadura spongiicola]